MGFDREIGWAAGWFLAEGGQDDHFRAGGRLGTLAGSEWQVTRLAETGIETEATLAFGSDGAVSGHAGCNRMRGSYTEDRGLLTIGPLATTRKLCPETLMDVEAAFLAALAKVHRAAAHHLVLALLDEQDRILAQFRRLDFD